MSSVALSSLRFFIYFNVIHMLLRPMSIHLREPVRKEVLYASLKHVGLLRLNIFPVQRTLVQRPVFLPFDIKTHPPGFRIATHHPAFSSIRPLSPCAPLSLWELSV